MRSEIRLSVIPYVSLLWYSYVQLKVQLSLMQAQMDNVVAASHTRLRGGGGEASSTIDMTTEHSSGQVDVEDDTGDEDTEAGNREKRKAATVLDDSDADEGAAAGAVETAATVEDELACDVAREDLVAALEERGEHELAKTVRGTGKLFDDDALDQQGIYTKCAFLQK